MDKKRFFRRKNCKSTQKYENSYAASGLGGVNVVLEAERIIEEYVSKMGYTFGKKRYTGFKIFALILITLCSLSAVAWLASKLISI